ncbi:MAG: hypothetical protein O9342_00215 [Beijerinckiaceae bacterium]|nr:hypothetical protein [Beijerinckiaceae bacterium]
MMRNAWATYRQLIAWGQGKPGRALFRAALRRAWADAKQNLAMMEIIRSLPKIQPAARPDYGSPIVWTGSRAMRGRSFAW